MSAALGVLLLFTATLGLAMVGRTGGHLVYPLDDTYIQMAIAKNLAAHGTWGVTRYEFSGAGSSLLWPLLLALLDRLTGLAHRLPLLVNALAAVVVTVLAYILLQRHIQSRASQALALTLLIVAMPLPTLILVGMEHTLQCAAVLALTMAAVRWCSVPTVNDRRLAIGVPCLACLTVATRYDAAAVVVAVTVLIVCTRGWRAGAPMILTSGIAPAVYAAVAWRHGWPAVPAPILLKQRLASIDPGSFHGVVDLVGGGALTVLVNTPALLVLALIAAALVALSPRKRDDRLERESLFLLLVFLIATAVHVQFGRTGWLYRYEAYLVMLGVVANASALARRLPASRPRFDAVQWAGIAVLIAISLHTMALRTFLASRDILIGAPDLYRHDYALSHFFRQYPPDGGLLVPSLGAVAYFTDVPIVDFAGLGTIELLPGHGSRKGDMILAHRVAQARGVRVSLVDKPGIETVTGWRCVAGWTAMQPAPPDTTWLFVSDDLIGATLASDLRAFAAEHRDGNISLTFADARHACPVDQ